jgi:hypothetical protein
MRRLVLTAFLVGCAEAEPASSQSAGYSVSLIVLDLSAAILVRDKAALDKYLDESFTLNEQPWKSEPLLEAAKQIIRKVRVTDAQYVTRGGATVPIPLTYIEPDAELAKLFSRRPPHESVKLDTRAVQREGVQSVSGSAQIFLLTGETKRIDFALKLQVDSDSVKVRKLRYTIRD